MESDRILKIDLNNILKDYQDEEDPDFKFERYLSDIWKDLSQRSSDQEKGIEKITFNKFYELPGILSERLFSIFDKNGDNFLSYTEFIIGMKTLFLRNSFETLAKLIFNFYDFNSSGKISREDVRVVLSYVPLQRNPTSNNKGIKENDFLTAKESQDVLNSILSTAFQDKKEMNLDEYMQVVKSINSDIFLNLLLFLLEKKPFSNESFKSYQLDMSISPQKITSRTPQMGPVKIASPSLNSKYMSPILRKKTIKTINVDEIKFEDILTIYSGANANANPKANTNQKSTFNNGKIKGNNNNNINNIINSNDYNFGIIENGKEDSKIQRRNRINFDNLENKSPLLSYRKNYEDKEGQEVEKNDTSADFNFGENEKSNTIRYEGYIYKLSDEGQMKKVFFKLIGKDLYYYKKRSDKDQKGMHNLSDAFPSIGDIKIIEDIKYYSIKIKFPQKERIYYFTKESERDIWIQKFQLALENKKLKDKYSIIRIVGRGKFGLVKLGINISNKQPVAIKILAKNKMDKEDIELAKTEIDILTISQHQNIINLYDVFETSEHYFIVMEFCKGGDLLSYFHRRNYYLDEKKACEIIFKLSKAIEFLHTYGIIHRDLKPENILMTDDTENADIRLLDFGLSKIIGPKEKCTEPFGTLSYAAPEVLLKVPYDKSVDLWGIGIIAYLLLSGELPFDDKHSETEIARQTVEDDPEFPSELWGQRSRESRKFVEALLKKNPAQRLTMKEILAHPWFKKFKVNNLDEED